MSRKTTLEEAITVVCCDRADAYGKPEDTFTLIADLWSVYTGYPITPKEVAIMMLLLKIAREKKGASKVDNYVDMAGYAACAEELMEAAANGY